MMGRGEKLERAGDGTRAGQRAWASQGTRASHRAGGMSAGPAAGGLLALSAAPLPVWMCLEVSLLHLKYGNI